MQQILEEIVEGMNASKCYVWDLSRKVGNSTVKIASYKQEEVNEDESLALLESEVKRVAKRNPSTIFVIEYYKDIRTKSDSRLGPFDFTEQEVLDLSNAMPHQMSSLGYVPQTLMQQELALMEQRNDIKLQKMKQDMEHDQRMQRIKEKEAQIKELEKEYTDQTAYIQKGIMKAATQVAGIFAEGKELAPQSGGLAGISIDWNSTKGQYLKEILVVLDNNLDTEADFKTYAKVLQTFIQRYKLEKSAEV